MATIIKSICKIDVVHFMTCHKISPIEDLQPAIQTLFCGEDESEQKNESTRPNILWSLHFSVNEYEVGSDILPPNVFSSPGPNASLDFDYYVLEVRIYSLNLFFFMSIRIDSLILYYSLHRPSESSPRFFPEKNFFRKYRTRMTWSWKIWRLLNRSHLLRITKN